MESYAKYIENIVLSRQENTLIEAAEIYKCLEDSVPEATFYKVLERMTKRGDLVHITKGLYYLPKQSRHGRVPIGEQAIVEHYTGNDRGVVVGYRLYNKVGLTTQVGKKIEVLSSNLRGQKKNIANVQVTACDVPLNEETKRVIETLEILQNYKKIENINTAALAKYMTAFTKAYSNDATITVIEGKKYKKSTIALLREFLNFHHVSNTLDRHLSSMSDYHLPRMEEFYEVASPRLHR